MKGINRIELIRATEEDAQIIFEIKQRAFSKEFELYGQKLIPPNFYSIEKQIKAIIEQPYYFKIIDNGVILGTVLVVDKGEGLFKLASICLDLNKQNQGIGTEVMMKIEQKFPEAEKWCLETPCLSYRNHHFYEKLGYKKNDEYVPVYAEESGFKLFSYIKNIKD